MEDSLETPFDPVDQLEQILCHWTPDVGVDLVGVFLDYMSRAGRSLDDTLNLNPRLCDALFGDIADSDADDLLLLVSQSSMERQKLAATCSISFPMISTRLKRINELSGSGNVAKEALPDVNSLLSPISGKAVIWQLSDIHFGRFNQWTNDPVELASVFGHIAGAHSLASPDYVIVSGDVSSIADSGEFDSFNKFCEHFATQVWGKQCPQRMLVVPGNHDTTWREDGTADRLEKFVTKIGGGGTCITPFGEKTQTFANPDVRVERYGTDSPTSPPLAVVTLENVGLEFILMVSAYYSGFVPKDFRELLSAKLSGTDLAAELIERVRSDTGGMSLEYLSLIARSVPSTELPKIALTHHHLTQYGSECTPNPLGFDLLKTLRTKNVNVVLHGHLHMFEPPDATRSYIDKLSYCIPCTTLCSHTWRRSPGFMIHVFERGDTPVLTSLEWELAEGRLFHWDSLRPAYRVYLSSNALSVHHF